MACVDEGFTYLFDVALAKTPFSRNLKSLRRARGLSQQKLAQEVGLKRSNIASYETGTVEPNAANFLRIAYFFDADPALLLELELSDHPVLTTDNHQRQEDILEMLSTCSCIQNRKKPATSRLSWISLSALWPSINVLWGISLPISPIFPDPFFIFAG
jgi:transcriptional regulator with XRE-family HTH domain